MEVGDGLVVRANFDPALGGLALDLRLATCLYDENGVLFQGTICYNAFVCHRVVFRGIFMKAILCSCAVFWVSALASSALAGIGQGGGGVGGGGVPAPAPVVIAVVQLAAVALYLLRRRR